jgi:hypothetical protein
LHILSSCLEIPYLQPRILCFTFSNSYSHLYFSSLGSRFYICCLHYTQNVL